MINLPDQPESPKAPPLPREPMRFPLDEDDEPDIVVDISSGDELDDDELDDEIERGFRGLIDDEIDDEPTSPRRAS